MNKPKKILLVVGPRAKEIATADIFGNTMYNFNRGEVVHYQSSFVGIDWREFLKNNAVPGDVILIFHDKSLTGRGRSVNPEFLNSALSVHGCLTLWEQPNDVDEDLRCATSNLPGSHFALQRLLNSGQDWLDGHSSLPSTHQPSGVVMKNKNYLFVVGEYAKQVLYSATDLSDRRNRSSAVDEVFFIPTLTDFNIMRAASGVLLKEEFSINHRYAIIASSSEVALDGEEDLVTKVERFIYELTPGGEEFSSGYYGFQISFVKEEDRAWSQAFDNLLRWFTSPRKVEAVKETKSEPRKIKTVNLIFVGKKWADEIHSSDIPLAELVEDMVQRGGSVATIDPAEMTAWPTIKQLKELHHPENKYFVVMNSGDSNEADVGYTLMRNLPGFKTVLIPMYPHAHYVHENGPLIYKYLYEALAPEVPAPQAPSRKSIAKQLGGLTNLTRPMWNERVARHQTNEAYGQPYPQITIERFPVPQEVFNPEYRERLLDKDDKLTHIYLHPVNSDAANGLRIHFALGNSMRDTFEKNYPNHAVHWCFDTPLPADFGKGEPGTHLIIQSSSDSQDKGLTEQIHEDIQRRWGLYGIVQEMTWEMFSNFVEKDNKVYKV